MDKGKCCSGLVERVCQFITEKYSVTGEPIGNLELHGKKGVGKVLNISRRTLAEETLGPWKGGQGLSGSQLGKGTIESGKLSFQMTLFQAMYQCKGLS